MRESIPLELVEVLSKEQIRLPDGSTKFIDNKRYGGNAEYVYELAECKCEICGESDAKKLLIHHGNGYSNDLEDLYLLCQSCHSKVERGSISCKHNRKSVTCNTLVTDGNTDKDKDEDLDKELEQDKKKKRKRFTPPTVDEVREYCLERNNGIDPQAFVDHYSARGWKYNGNVAMKDWKAAVRTWEKNRREGGRDDYWT